MPAFITSRTNRTTPTCRASERPAKQRSSLRANNNRWKSKLLGGKKCPRKQRIFPNLRSFHVAQLERRAGVRRQGDQENHNSSHAGSGRTLDLDEKTSRGAEWAERRRVSADCTPGCSSTHPVRRAGPVPARSTPARAARAASVAALQETLHRSATCSPTK